MPCSDERRRRSAWRWLVGGLALLAGAASAHKSSDSYLQIEAAPSHLHVRWDIALRDLDVALDLDADGDGKLTWGEIKAAWPRIEAYALPRLRIDDCQLKQTGQALERRNDGAYAVLELESSCTLPAHPAIGYALFTEVDPTHRGIAKIQRPGESVELVVLEPSPFDAGTGSAGTAGTATASASSAGGHPDAAPASNRWQFLKEGIRHILSGYDHVLFLLCLLLPAVLRKTPQGWRAVDRLGDALWPVLGIVSAFTVAHSITLALASLHIVSVPPSFIDPAIAATIFLAALDNIRPFFPARRIAVAFAFGLVHGFGFASVLSELHLAMADFAWALLQFNVGLEIGQLVVVLAASAVLYALRDWKGYRPVILVGGSLIAMGVAAVWFVQRVTV